ncbi:MAG: extensin family protein [Kofleriaceae bacterium]|nr:extensin family protein [Kofleriaceae bacterium]
MRLIIVVGAIGATGAALASAGQAHAEPAAARCRAELDARKITYKIVSRKGVANAVEVTSALGGITYTTDGAGFILDCSLAVSLDEAGSYLTALGFTQAYFSGAYSRRNVRGTNRPSKHSFGLAIDVHRFTGAQLGTVRVDRDFEQGLGDQLDCIGAPLTEAGAALKIAQCQLVNSGLFSLVLSPDYDDAHYDHFHLEVVPWDKRQTLRATKPAQW